MLADQPIFICLLMEYACLKLVNCDIFYVKMSTEMVVV